MGNFVLFAEKIVMAVIKVVRVFKWWKLGDTTEDAVLDIVDDSFEKIFG